MLEDGEIGTILVASAEIPFVKAGTLLCEILSFTSKLLK
jgi:hypothetical protein